MKKYCPLCGKKLVDGKCTCKENNNIINYIIDYIKKPIDTTSEFIEVKNNEISYILLIITSLFLGLITSNFFFFGFYRMSKMKYFLIFTLLVFALFIVFTSITYFISKYIIKEEVNFEDILKVTSISSVSFILTGILYLIFYYLLNTSFLPLLCIGGILFSINYFFGISKISNIDHNKIPYLYIVSLLVIMFLALILI